jgi:hypothetical protein
MTVSFYTTLDFDLHFDYIDNHKHRAHRKMPLL